MKRSPLWWAAYVHAWQRMRGLRVFPPGPPLSGSIDHGEPLPTADIARRCAAEADECEAGFVEAFGVKGDEATIGEVAALRALETAQAANCRLLDRWREIGPKLERIVKLEAAVEAARAYLTANVGSGRGAEERVLCDAVTAALGLDESGDVEESRRNTGEDEDGRY